MRYSKDVGCHIATERLTKIICQKLMGARGSVYTLKPKQLCDELFFGKYVHFCTVKVREYLLSTLGDAIVLADKKYIVVMVKKAWEILACGQRSGKHEN